MSKEDFLLNEVKERILKGLNTKTMAYIENHDQMDQDNLEALNYFQNNDELIKVANTLIETAKLEAQNSGLVAGNKEILNIINFGKARDVAVNYYKSTLQ